MIVAIHGLGLMGASLGAALRRKRHRVIGVARRQSVARRAVELHACDEATTDLNAVSRADVVILATPIRVILKTLPDVARRMRRDALLTDIGSTKTAIMALRPRVPFVGGHPMAGNEKSGVEARDATLYRGTPYLLIRSRTTRPRDVTTMMRLARDAGARPLWLSSAERHDRIMASVSNFPYLCAYALTLTADDRRAAGPSFRDATRVAASDVDMIFDVLTTNAPAIRSHGALFLSTLERLIRQLSTDRRAFRQTLERCRAIASPTAPAPSPKSVRAPSSRDSR